MTNIETAQDAELEREAAQVPLCERCQARPATCFRTDVPGSTPGGHAALCEPCFAEEIVGTEAAADWACE